MALEFYILPESGPHRAPNGELKGFHLVVRAVGEGRDIRINMILAYDEPLNFFVIEQTITRCAMQQVPQKSILDQYMPDKLRTD